MNHINFTAALQLMPDQGSTSKLSQRTQHLVDYFVQGHEHYQSNISKEDPWEFEETHGFLMQLLELSNSLSVNAGSIFLTLHKDDHQINVYPLMEFLDRHPAAECIEQINVVHTALVEYVHSGNCVDFKSAFRTLQQWRYVFLEIQQS